MFEGIAKRYDLLNHLLSLNIDKGWRTKVVKALQPTLSRPDSIVLDVACGTGDLSLALREASAGKVIGSDFCRPMLTIAAEKRIGEPSSLPFVEGNAMSLPFEDDSFDAVTIAFGLRNLPNFLEGLKEMRRVLKPGGKLAVLEFSAPAIPGMRQAFNFYFMHILPRIGSLVSGSDHAYTYLPESVKKFPAQRELAAMMADAGFANVGFTNVTGGIAAIHIGEKAA